LRTTVARAAHVVMAAAVGITLALTATPALGQEPVTPPVRPPVADQPTQPTEVDKPDPLLSALAHCPKGVPTVEVHVRSDRDEPFKIDLVGTSTQYAKDLDTELDPENLDHVAIFADVPPGRYRVAPREGDQSAGGVEVVVTDCKSDEPAKTALDVEVACKAGWGIVTFVVANAEGESKHYTLATDDLETQWEVDLGDGTFLRVTENGFEDGEYAAILSGEHLKEPIRKEFTVACAAENAPKLKVTAHCDGKDDVASPAAAVVEITNPNRSTVEYTIKGAGTDRVLPVGGGSTGLAELDSLPAGDYTVSVYGSDSTVTKTGVAVDDCATVEFDQDGLQVHTRCVGGESDVVFRFFPTGPGKRTFKVDGNSRYDTEIEFTEERYQWERWTGDFADGTYTARLTGDDVNTVEKFTVNCSGAPSTDTTGTPAPTTTVPPQASPGPADDDLPVTGAAVGGMVAVGAAALVLGAGLLMIVRRRRATK